MSGPKCSQYELDQIAARKLAAEEEARRKHQVQSEHRLGGILRRGGLPGQVQWRDAGTDDRLDRNQQRKPLGGACLDQRRGQLLLAGIRGGAVTPV